MELRLQFESNDWHKGAQMHDQTRYKRPYSHDRDYIERQQTMSFEEEDN